MVRPLSLYTRKPSASEAVRGGVCPSARVPEEPWGEGFFREARSTVPAGASPIPVRRAPRAQPLVRAPRTTGRAPAEGGAGQLRSLTDLDFTVPIARMIENAITLVVSPLSLAGGGRLGDADIADVHEIFVIEVFERGGTP